MPATESPPLEARGLRKRYGAIAAVDGIDLTVGRGDIYGFLGPNGAGKTTAMRIVLGLIRPDAGQVRLFGRDPQRNTRGARRCRGVRRDASLLPVPVRAQEPGALRRARRWRSGEPDRESLDIVELAGARATGSEPIRRACASGSGWRCRCFARPGCSSSTSQRTGSTRGGIRDSGALILRPVRGRNHDLPVEPPAGRDRRALHARRDRSLRTIVFEGALDELHAGGGTRYRLHTTDQSLALQVCSRTEGINDLAVEGGELVFSSDEPTVVQLSRELVGAGAGIASLVPKPSTLEDLFFELTEGPASMRPTALTAYRWELRKLVSQKRTYIGLGAAALLHRLRRRDEPADGWAVRRSARPQPAQDRAGAGARRAHVRVPFRRSADHGTCRG